MATAEKFKRPIWIAPRTVTNGVPEYGTPVLYNWNWGALYSSVDILAFGPSYVDYRQAITNNDEVDNIIRLDKVWLDVTPSDPTDTMAADADFYVFSVDPGAGGVAKVRFKRLSPDG